MTAEDVDAAEVTRAPDSSPPPFRGWLRFLPAVCVVVAVRLRFIWTPITSDEGGFLAIARAWQRGASLYDEVWVDRPQGLIILYRVLHVIGLGTPEGVRLLAVAACVAGAVACGIAAEELYGRRAGPITAVVVGALTSVPQYEGFIANGELLSGAVGAVGLALLLRACWNRPQPAWRLLFAGGVVCGAAFCVKQSGFDAFACGLAAVAFRTLGRRWTLRQRAAALPTVVAGFCVALGAAFVHGAATGWDRYWYAVFGYRSSQRSALRDANWDRFWETWHIAAPALVPTFVVAVAAVWFAIRRDKGAVVVALAWLPAAAAAFVLGGQFHRHYWVILAFPLGTIAAGWLATVGPRAARIVGVVALVAAPLVLAARATVMPRDDVGPRLSGDVRLTKDEHIATWFEQHARPGESIYVLCASAGLYGNLSVDPPFPYLWHDPVVNVPGVGAAIAALVESPTRPTFVAAYQSTRSCGTSGRTDAALDRHYRQVTTIDGVPILARIDRS